MNTMNAHNIPILKEYVPFSVERIEGRVVQSAKAMYVVMNGNNTYYHDNLIILILLIFFRNKASYPKLWYIQCYEFYIVWCRTFLQFHWFLINSRRRCITSVRLPLIVIINWLDLYYMILSLYCNTIFITSNNENKNFSNTYCSNTKSLTHNKWKIVT